MRENNFGNNNSVHNLDQRRFQNFDNYQDDVSHPVTLKNVRDIVAELLVQPQSDRPINNNNSVHGRNRNSARHPSPRPGPSRNPREGAGGTGV